ncbi:uncharacterized protein LOC141911215 [Tubulanus polymorphus]|uniref:uncharacterized protein LOC141911215 n=1 Tax=Tubulanus polymorphus TaxID=672921 RepID=UPI003DA5D785
MKLTFPSPPLLMSLPLLIVLFGFPVALGAKTNEEVPHRAQVLILGAGAAGISAAKYLHDHGVKDFVIIDAENRIGGRVKASEFGGKIVELGANWVQGTDGNPLWDLAKKYKMAGVVSNYDSYVTRDVNGNDVTSVSDAAFRKFARANRVVDRIREFRQKNKMADVPLRGALRYGGWPMRRTPVEDVVEMFDIDFEFAVPADEMTVLYQPALQENYKQEDFFITDQRGFGYILEQLADEFLTDGATRRLYLNETITRVSYDGQGVKVKTKSGKTFSGDYAICTFSIGVLQSDAVKFVPRFPEKRQLAFNSFTMGTYTKIFMRFNASAQRFWDDEEYILYAHPTRGYYAMWQNLEAVGLHPAGTNILLVSVFDDEADRVSRLPVATVEAELTAVLRSMYGAQVPEPVEILVPDWHTNPLYYGSFSNWPPWMSADTHALMGAPLNHTLYFAGEAYSVGYYGYLHGAMHSGNQTAQQIISSIGLKSA